MTNWYCGRCVLKLEKTVDNDPLLIRVCDGCGIENYCSCETEVGESTPLVIHSEEELEALPKEIADKLTEPIELEAETVEELEVLPDLPEEVTETINETMTPKEKEIADLREKLAELEAKE